MSTTIHQANTFKARPKRIYDILMSSREHAAMTANGSAKVSRKEGGAFYCHGGWIGGRNVELVPGKRIVQAWRAKNWPKGIYSLGRVLINSVCPLSGVKRTCVSAMQ